MAPQVFRHLMGADSEGFGQKRRHRGHVAHKNIDANSGEGASKVFGIYAVVIHDGSLRGNKDCINIFDVFGLRPEYHHMHGAPGQEREGPRHD